jgi:hypothetical protein
MDASPTSLQGLTAANDLNSYIFSMEKVETAKEHFSKHFNMRSGTTAQLRQRKRFLNREAIVIRPM